MTFDLTASILAATGTSLPDGHRPDGMDILPILRGDAPLVERRLFWRIARPDRQQRAVRSGPWKLLVDGAHLFLFDVTADPGERTDLSAQHPARVVSLGRMLADWEKDMDRDRGSRTQE